MAYAVENFKTKKALKEAVASGARVEVYQPNDYYGDGTVRDGRTTLEGPHYPQPHKWWAGAVVKDGAVVQITS